MIYLLLILFLGGGLAWASERWNPQAPRRVALAVVSFALLYLVVAVARLPVEQFNLLPAASQPDTWLAHTRFDWMPRFGIHFELAMDGLSLTLVALTLLLGLIALSASWSEIDQRTGFFQANLLWSLTGVVGVFMALDLFLFFVFYEVMLVPMYLLIAIWGHEARSYASMKFFIFTQASGLLMLVSIVVLAYQHALQTGSFSFSYFDLLDNRLDPALAFWVMLGFFLAFTVKLPGFPFHTWLPDAHTQAPTAGSVLLAGILLKTGAYGLLRFAIPLFPDAAAEFAPVAMALGAAGIIYGAVLAFAQSDFKRLVAYSSVSHMGFVLLGLYAWNSLAVQGAIVQMVAHGLSTAALFMIAGSLQQRMHTRDMGRMGGLWLNAPRMGACALFFTMASLGLPGLGNFVAEFLVLLGLFQVAPRMAVIAAVGLVTGAVYSLIMLQRSFQGPGDPERTVPDYGRRELATMLLMVALLIWLGVNPQPLLELTQPTVDSLLPGAAP